MAEQNFPAVPFVNSDAPTIYCDGVPNYGYANAIANVTLEVLRFADDNKGGVTTTRVAAAHLRMNIQAVQSLHAALGNILLMAAKTEGSPN